MAKMPELLQFADDLVECDIPTEDEIVDKLEKSLLGSLLGALTPKGRNN